MNLALSAQIIKSPPRARLTPAPAAAPQTLAKEGIDLEYVQFSDYSLPNEALNAGEIDINAFQHHAYFNNDVEKNGYDITPIADTFIIAMNLYSDKVKSVDEIKDGDVIAIPDDASNGGRALKVLASARLITLKAEAGAEAGA